MEDHCWLREAGAGWGRLWRWGKEEEGVTPYFATQQRVQMYTALSVHYNVDITTRGAQLDMHDEAGEYILDKIRSIRKTLSWGVFVSDIIEVLWDQEQVSQG